RRSFRLVPQRSWWEADEVQRGSVRVSLGRRWLLLAGALVVSTAGGGAPRMARGGTAHRWPGSAPPRAGMDEEVLRRADALARQNRFPNLLALLVARHGRIVFEHYYRGFRGTNPLDLFSITKSVTSAATGIAIADGRIQSVDEPLSRFFRGKL